MDHDRSRKIFDVTAWTIGIVSALVLVTHEALAEGRSLSATNPTYKSQCSGCHLAYPPALLPSDSWRAILNNLDQHFGTDATVDDKALAEIRAFLQRNAGRDRPAVGQPVLRITETSWFRREHDEVPTVAWKSATVKSPANCAACHNGAENGDFSERGLRVQK